MATDDSAVNVRAAGPLSGAFSARDSDIYLGKTPLAADSGANALLLTRRVAFTKPDHAPASWKPDTPVRTWAARARLGQDTPLLAAAQSRRAALLRAWRGHGLRVARLRLVTEWRLVVGLGHQFGANEFGLSLHGTYGWPVLPGSGLKGLAAAAASDTGAAPDLVRAVLGGPRPSPRDTGEHDRPESAPVPEKAQRGAVVFLDALPAGEAVAVHDDVITPHQQPYYADTMRQDPHPDPRPPAEHHQPVPVPFLSVSGAFHVDLASRDPDALEQAVAWLAAAGQDLGAGGRTSAGYGYFDCEPVDLEDT